MKIILTIILNVFCVFAFSQNAPQWGNLKPGSYAIGYETIRTVDYSRNYFEKGRPIQIYIWYPAAAKANSTYLNYGTYFDDASYDWGSNPKHIEYLKNSFVKGFKSASLNPSFPGTISDTQFQSIINTPIPVIRKADPANGKFPVLLHTHVNGVLHQSIMMEYLASHGYVVMSTSAYNTPGFYGRGEEGTNSLLNLTEDLAFVLSQARALAYADTENTAMIGMFAHGGLSLQAKEMSLKAIALLDCVDYPDNLKQLPYYDPKKIRIPLLELINSDFEDPTTDQTKTFLDSLIFSERYIGRFKEFNHADFYPFPKISRPEESAQWKKHELMLYGTLNFLNAVLKNDANGKAFLTNPVAQNGLPADFLSIRKTPAKKAIPTESEFLTWLRYGDMEQVRNAWNTGGKAIMGQNSFKFFFTALLLARDGEPHAEEAVKLYLASYAPDERIFNQFGYSFMSARQPQKALGIFELYVKQFPNSPYAYNALSNVYLALSERGKAKVNAQKVLKLLDAVQLPPQEKESLMKSANEKINLK